MAMPQLSLIELNSGDLINEKKDSIARCCLFFMRICLWAIQTLVPAGCCYMCCMAYSRALRVNRNTLGARKSSLY